MFDATRFCIGTDTTIRQALACIDANGRGIALVTDGAGRLVGAVVDGDVRRAVLANLGLDRPVRDLLAMKADSPYATPVVAHEGMDPAALAHMMREKAIRQVPVVDDAGRPVDLVTQEDVPVADLPVQAIIMAGGQGTRLRPLTDSTPKPMLPLGDKPILGHIMEQLRSSGIREVNVTTNYLAEKIRGYFRDGRDFGVKMTYVDEERPLGTAGALGLVGPASETILVINGDILTRVDFRGMLEFHREHLADLTVAVRRFEVSVPYGVLELDGALVRSLREKPTQSFFVNAGIYLLEPSVQKSIPRGERIDMTDVIQDLIAKGRTVASFPIYEYWMDIGQHADYAKAQADVASGRLRA